MRRGTWATCRELHPEQVVAKAGAYAHLPLSARSALAQDAPSPAAGAAGGWQWKARCLCSCRRTSQQPACMSHTHAGVRTCSCVEAQLHEAHLASPETLHGPVCMWVSVRRYRSHPFEGARLLRPWPTCVISCGTLLAASRARPSGCDASTSSIMLPAARASVALLTAPDEACQR